MLLPDYIHYFYLQQVLQTKGSLRRHRIIHDGRRYQCEHCTFSTVRELELNYHTMAKHTQVLSCINTFQKIVPTLFYAIL